MCRRANVSPSFVDVNEPLKFTTGSVFYPYRFENIYSLPISDTKNMKLLILAIVPTDLIYKIEPLKFTSGSVFFYPYRFENIYSLPISDTKNMELLFLADSSN